MPWSSGEDGDGQGEPAGSGESREGGSLLPDYAEGHLTLARPWRSWRLEGSIPEFKRALELQPNSTRRTRLRSTLRRKGNLADAIAAFREAIRFRPSSPKPTTSWAGANEEGDRNGAAAAFQKVLQVDPGMPQLGKISTLFSRKLLLRRRT